MIPKPSPRSSARSAARLGQLVALWVVCAALIGCQAGTSPRVEEESAPPLDLRARELIAQGWLFEAAEEYLRLSRQAGAPEADYFLLEAATLLVDAGDPIRARSLGDSVQANPRDPQLEYRKRLLAAALELTAGQAALALELVPRELPAGVPPSTIVRGYLLRARAHAELGQQFESARFRTLADPFMANAAQRAENHAAIWQRLLQTPLDQREALRQQLPPDDDLAGWLELAAMWEKELAAPATLAASMQSWSLRFAEHPANTEFVPKLAEESNRLGQPPRKVALLLPFDGPFAAAAVAIRDGFVAAWYADSANQDRPELALLDSSSGDIRAVYARAVAENSNFVVGPLRKDVLAELVANGPLPVPTLMLNRLRVAESGLEDTAEALAAPSDAESTSATTLPLGQAGVLTESTQSRTLGGAPLYEFALSPEEEAQRVAERAWFDGHGRAAVITPQGAWGERVSRAFVAAWETLGGLVVAREFYPADAPDMSPSVMALLNVDRSKERAQTLRSLLGAKLKHVARPRSDVDFIFMAAFPTQARQLQPTFKFHHAADVPIYATSHIYAGSPDPALDRDLEGIIFGDMPWILDSAVRHPNKAVLERIWPDLATGLSRLYAFGADAYALVTRAGKLKAQTPRTFAGNSGSLSVGRHNAINRQLVFATFENGLPRLLDAPSQLAQ